MSQRIPPTYLYIVDRRDGARKPVSLRVYDPRSVPPAPVGRVEMMPTGEATFTGADDDGWGTTLALALTASRMMSIAWVAGRMETGELDGHILRGWGWKILKDDPEA